MPNASTHATRRLLPLQCHNNELPRGKPARLRFVERRIELKTVQADALRVTSCNSSLLPDFLRNALSYLRPVLPHRTSEISATPKLTAPKLLLHLWTPTEYFSSRQTLDHSHELRNAVYRDTLH